MVVGTTPLVGEHTESILKDILDYSDEKIQALEESEVVRAAETEAVEADD